jgi:ketosteroid isomerase-like protein
MAAIDDGIVWTVPPVDGWGGEHRGKDAVLGFFGSLPGRYGQWTLAIDELVDAGDRLLVVGHHEFPDSDRIPFAHVWTLRGGKAATFIEYVDNAALRPHVIGAPVG